MYVQLYAAPSPWRWRPCTAVAHTAVFSLYVPVLTNYKLDIFRKYIIIKLFIYSCMDAYMYSCK